MKKKKCYGTLPKPKHEMGYKIPEIKKICKDRDIDIKDFWEAFGVNTCMLDSNDNKVVYYVCDVEKALWKLKKPGGKYHLWD